MFVFPFFAFLLFIPLILLLFLCACFPQHTVRRELEDVGDQLAAAKRRLADAEFGAEAAQRAQRALEAERTELDARLAAKTEEAARIAAELAALRTATADGDARLAASSARCAAQDAALTELRATLAERDRTVAALREKLADDELLRRKLHNTIQDLKGNIRVFCRVRPSQQQTQQTQQQQQLYVLDPADPRKLDVVETGTAATGRRQQTRHAFVYDHVFGPGATQEDVFEELAVFVQSVLDGYSCCVFAYGQTGSGKTYTMEGPSAPDTAPSCSPEGSSPDSSESGEGEVRQGAPERGVIPRTVELLFRTMRDLEERGWRYTLDVRFLEVYNEQLRDLLAARSGSGSAAQTLKIQHDPSGRTSVAGCQTVRVESPEAVYALIRTARAARAVAATRYNDYSSRSHSVFQLHLHGRNEQRRETVESVLNLVDLAGSERLSATTPSDTSSGSGIGSGGIGGSSATTSARQKETLNINLSLLNLRKVITALAAKQAHVPYRESVLTQLLQNALGGECKMLMFVNVSPEPANLSQSLSSLKFASTANKCVTGVVQRHAQKGVVAPPSAPAPTTVPSSKQR